MSGSYHQLLREHWDQLHGQDVGGKIKLFWPVAKKDDEALLEWLDNTVSCLEDENESRAVSQVNYIRFYNAMEEISESHGIRSVDYDGQSISRKNMFIMNHARDFVNQAVSRLMRYSLAMNVLPQNNEYTDRLASRLQKRTIGHCFQVNDLPDMARGILTEAKCCGESHLVVEYDPTKGDLNPAYVEAQKLKEKVPGTKFTDVEGDEIDLETVKRTGEVEYTHPIPWLVLSQPQWRNKDVEYRFFGEIKHIDTVKAENPDIDFDEVEVLSSIKASSERHGPGFDYGQWVVEWTFYHRGIEFLDKGYYAKFIKGKLIKRGDNPYSHREIPSARFTDIDDPANAHGRSFFDDIRPPLVLHNKLMNLMYRNIAIGAHPKLMVPEGSCNYYSMANAPFVVEYQYPMKPELMTFNTIGGEVFTYSEGLMKQVQQISGTFGISRGEQLPNARAAAILNFYEEQESERESTQIAKYNAWGETVAKLSVATAGDFYQVEDGRTLRVFGKTNEHKIRKVEDVAKLSGPYDIRIERTTALAESKQGRIDQIVSLSQIPLTQGETEVGKPGLFTREQVLRMVEVADTPSFFEMSTAAVEKAESENEDMYEGMPVESPEKWEAHLQHWNVHYQFIQSREFTEVKNIPPQVKDQFLKHLAIHEFWMYKLAERSLTFCQGLMENVYYPVVWDMADNISIMQLIMMHQTPPPPPMPPEALMPPPEGELPPEGAPEDLPLPPEEMPLPMEELPPEADLLPEEMPPLKIRKLTKVLRDENGNISGLDSMQEPLL
jgi:hypothetical protein